MEIENSCTMKTAFEICDNMQLLTLEKGNEVMAMSSIAYITNHEMIEYHRLHGSSEIVFWRFSWQRKFQNFNHGDYLFFLTKGTEKGKQKEKGIVGYARYSGDTSGSVKSIWKKYESKCGYGSQQQFIRAIMKYHKQHTLPDKIYCLLLEQVIFFQSPIYLSELDHQVSKRVESYIYLDQEDSELSWKIMKKGMEIGIDLWSTFVERRDEVIQNDADIISIQQLHDRYTQDIYTNYEKRRITAFVNSILKDTNGVYLSGAENDFFIIESTRCQFFIPCIITIKAWRRSLLYATAKAKLYQQELTDKNSSSKVSILFDDKNKEAIRMCEKLGISFRIIKL